ncbi:MAG: 16S rRNA (guanine(527)-N(7))-methyltransferase RsmG [Nitratireductor sp.]|nr:16S rRNA (guanine(527)-N(7))-methyltransferase RsmG [Nitratireductor sp.]
MTTGSGPSRAEIDLLNSIYPVSRETISRLERYNAILRQWQAKTNLVAPSTLDEFWSRHVADSLQIVALKSDARRWTDIGSGGGFPGLVMAIVLGTEKPGSDLEISLVESIRKKCAFLSQVALQTGIRVNVHPKRIEDATDELKGAEVITARALASLEKLLELTGDQISGDRVALFHKGRDYRAELEECRGKWDFDLLVHESVLGADSVVLEIANARRL